MGGELELVLMEGNAKGRSDLLSKSKGLIYPAKSSVAHKQEGSHCIGLKLGLSLTGFTELIGKKLGNSFQIHRKAD